MVREYKYKTAHDSLRGITTSPTTNAWWSYYIGQQSFMPWENWEYILMLPWSILIQSQKNLAFKCSNFAISLVHISKPLNCPMNLQLIIGNTNTSRTKCSCLHHCLERWNRSIYWHPNFISLKTTCKLLECLVVLTPFRPNWYVKYACHIDRIADNCG